MSANAEQELDFNSESYNGFYYTNDKQIRKMDDKLVISKIVEKYPDFARSDDENVLKQVFSVIASDTKFIKKLMSELDMSVKEIFSVVYRKYSFMFSGSFVSKIQKIVVGRAYARVPKGQSSKNARKEQEQRELLARMFKYLSQDNNPMIVRKVPFDRISAKSFYKAHKKTFDKMHAVMKKYGIKPYRFLKFALTTTNVFTPELIFKPAIFMAYARKLEATSRLETVYANYSRSVDSAAEICVSRNISAKEFVKSLFTENRIAYEYISGRLSKYFIVAIQDFENLYEHLDNMNKEELGIIYNASDELKNVLNDASVLSTGKGAFPISDIEAAIRRKNETIKNQPKTTNQGK